MKLFDAKEIAYDLEKDDKLGQHINVGMVCGSIRREKEFVKDIDWVIVPFTEEHYQFGEESLDATITRLHEGEDPPKLGKLIKSFLYKKIQVELYIANPATFDCLTLIRTGSAEHNTRLASIAKYKHLKLFASGKGLCKIKGGIYNNEPEEIVEVIATTEKDILTELLGKYVEPKDRK